MQHIIGGGRGPRTYRYRYRYACNDGREKIEKNKKEKKGDFHNTTGTGRAPTEIGLDPDGLDPARGLSNWRSHGRNDAGFFRPPANLTVGSKRFRPGLGCFLDPFLDPSRSWCAGERIFRLWPLRNPGRASPHKKHVHTNQEAAATKM